MDLITYIPDLTAFRAEAQTLYETKATDTPHVASSLVTKQGGSIIFSVDKIPVVYSNDNKSLCLIRIADKTVLESISSMQIIGECIDGVYEFYAGGKVLYESVYDTSSKTINVEGETKTYTPPYQIGVFA